MPRIEKARALSLVAAETARLPGRYEGCVMCGMVGGFPADLELLAESPRAVAVLDRFATRPGHVLVVLRRHAESIAALPWEDYAEVQRMSWESARALEHVLAPARVYVAALGAAARLPNSFPHHHVHVIPLPSGGEEDRPARVFSWEHGVHVYAEGEARALAEAIRKAWPARDAR
jgi:diadenosine tetraphosphate (Ap4A) HIT family hydrolase